MDILSIILLVGGIILLFVSFANMENITGLWVAGDIQRDEQFVNSGRFMKRVYLILRITGLLMAAAGVILMTVVR
jgi:hypothetical protein